MLKLIIKELKLHAPFTVFGAITGIILMIFSQNFPFKVAHNIFYILHPNAGHVFLSTWASIFHMIMAIGQPLNWIIYLGVFVFLFLAVWIPCCVSDIVFPLLFVKEKNL